MEVKKALVTGASSGIGKDIAIYLSKLGYDLILVARREEKLLEIKDMLKTNVKTICLDLTVEENCYKLYELTKKYNVDILINNAGFGDFGKFYETDIDKELNMINLNIKALHILTKLYIKDMVNKNNGYILNVGSMASFAPGPLMSTYYATKSYVLRLTEGISKELKYSNSNVKISVLCPGPVDTEFNRVANVNFSIKPLSSEFVAKYAVDKLLDGKCIIIPGVMMKLGHFFSRFLSDNALAYIMYRNQKNKTKKVK